MECGPDVPVRASDRPRRHSMSRRSPILWLVIAASGICGAASAAHGQQGDNAVQQPAMVPASVPASAPAASDSNVGTAGATASPAPAPASATRSAGTAHASSAASPAVRERESLLIEGEKRFGTNCGRCHQSPHHFPPRMMATVVRHMRVRATITDEDMRLILLYMTQ